MTAAFSKPCAKPGCRAITTDRYCAEHRQYGYREIAKHRGSTTERGYDGRWRKARIAHLIEYPLCAACARLGRSTAATDVDHIRPHKGNPDLMWEPSNWQSLCQQCHGRKSHAESIGKIPDNYLVAGE